MNKITVNKSSITPLINQCDTQILLQRHCKYDREKGILLPESIEEQKKLIASFLETLDQTVSLEELRNTYLLFIASNTDIPNDSISLKRCVETTKYSMIGLQEYYTKRGLDVGHIINVNELSNYNKQVKESTSLEEPKMLSDDTGYAEYLKEKHDGMNLDFWIDFEEDQSKEKREELHAEGPDQIVERAIHFIKVLQRYSKYFHETHPNSKLIIWCGTHYDLISPLVKQSILGYEKSDSVQVDYCGGISLLLTQNEQVIAHVNGTILPFGFPNTLQQHQHFQK